MPIVLKLKRSIELPEDYADAQDWKRSLQGRPELLHETIMDDPAAFIEACGGIHVLIESVSWRRAKP